MKAFEALESLLAQAFQAELLSKAYREGELKPHDMTKDSNSCNCCGKECNNSNLRMCGECACVSCTNCRCEGECPNCNCHTWALS